MINRVDCLELTRRMTLKRNQFGIFRVFKFKASRWTLIIIN